MKHTFPSLAFPNKYAYAYDSEAYDTRSTLESKFRMFETYGDGLCQHSGDWSVTVEHIADYLASMAQSLLDIRDDERRQRIYQAMFFILNRKPSVKQIEFAASIVFKESDKEWGSRRYYSIKEIKVSKSSAKEHDKRYAEIPSWADGSADAIYRLLVPEYADGIDRYAYLSAIRDWAIASDRGYMQLPAEWLGWFKNDPDYREKSLAMRDAWEMCWNVCESFRLKDSALGQLEHYSQTLARKNATPETQTA